MFASITVMSFGALLAYISGMGSVFNGLSGVAPKTRALIFWAFASIIICLGIEANGKSELAISLVMLVLFMAVGIMLLPKGRIENVAYSSTSSLWKIVGVSIFASAATRSSPTCTRALEVVRTRKTPHLGIRHTHCHLRDLHRFLPPRLREGNAPDSHAGP